MVRRVDGQTPQVNNTTTKPTGRRVTKTDTAVDQINVRVFENNHLVLCTSGNKAMLQRLQQRVNANGGINQNGTIYSTKKYHFIFKEVIPKSR